MYAVFIRLADSDKLDELLQLMLEVGVSDGLVLSGASMNSILEKDVPLFAGLLSAFPSAHPTGELVVAASPDRESIERLYQLGPEVDIDFRDPESAQLMAVKTEDFS